MHRLITILLAVTTLICGAAGQAKAEPLYALGGTNILLSFDSATPGSVVSRPITGLGVDTFLTGIDFRPANGLLYGFTGGRMWIINPLTAAATFVSMLTTPAGGGENPGIDFNPVTDRLRIISRFGQNVQVNVDTGQTIIDGMINPVNPEMMGVAYTNNFAGATSTILYGIGAATDALYTIDPTTGTITLVGGLGVDTARAIGFDISGVSGIAYAALLPVGSFSSSLYTINLATGQATLVGQIGGPAVASLTAAPAGSAVIPEPTTMVLLSSGLLGVGAAARKRRKAGK